MDVGQSAFNQMFWNSAEHILKRECTGCADSHQEIYYKRLTMLDSFDLYSSTAYWQSQNNNITLDFNLYSTLADALNDTNRWTFCNYNDVVASDSSGEVGMFRDCGQNGKVDWQWTSRSYSVHGGGAKPSSFFIYNETGMV